MLPPTKRLLLRSCKNNPCCKQLAKAITNENVNATNKLLMNANIWSLSGIAMVPIAFYCNNFKVALIAIPCMFMGDIYMEAYDRIKNDCKHTQNSK